MNGVDLDRLLREQANPSTALPAHVSQRIEQTLHTLPDREAARRRMLIRRWCLSAVSFVIIGVLVAAFAMFSTPDMKSALNRMPLVGSLFFDADGKLGESVTDKGITFTIRRVMYDGFAMSIDYVYQSNDEMEGTALDFNLKVDDLLIDKFENNKSPNVEYLHINDQQLDTRMHEGVIMVKLNRYRPESFHMQLEVTKLGHTSGKWLFEMPVTTSRTTPSINLALHKSNDELAITLDKIIFNPLTTEVQGDYVMQDTSSKLAVGLEVEDESGYIYGTDDFRDGRLFVSHLNAEKRHLVLRPYYYNNEGIYSIENRQRITQILQKPPTGAEPFVIPRTGDNKIVITALEYLEDRILVHYHTEGSSPVMESSLYIEDEQGELMYPVAATKLVHSDSEYVDEFMRLTTDENINFVTWPVPPITYIPELEMRVDLPQ